MTALVGPSGSGKSTIANLLARLWDVKSGNVTIRGVDIRNVPLSELMNQISMVFQRVYLFQDTIYNNIIMGKPDATEEEVYEAARKARCYDFIMALPDGFQTVVGEGGATLSGGEKQRISIARCILKDAPIVILDEATASVDTDNESYIQEAISELVKGKTLLVIAHRLNTIQNADQILVIDNGQIAQQGTHEKLLKQPGIYQEFCQYPKECGWLESCLIAKGAAYETSYCRRGLFGGRAYTSKEARYGAFRGCCPVYGGFKTQRMLRSMELYERVAFDNRRKPLYTPDRPWLGMWLEKIYERHCFFTHQLISVGVNPQIAEVDACRMEHAVSDESFQKLKEHAMRGIAAQKI